MNYKKQGNYIRPKSVDPIKALLWTVYVLGVVLALVAPWFMVSIGAAGMLGFDALVLVGAAGFAAAVLYG